MVLVVPFPHESPAGYEWLADEPTFDPAVHLQLEAPSELRRLTEFGYSTEELAQVPTEVAVSAPFRVLSDSGVTVMLETARRLRAFSGQTGGRIDQATRAGCYRSRWLRDLCLSSEVNAVMSDIYGATVAPHPMASHLGHLNYEPADIGRTIDKWHHDTLPLDYVLMVTDPATVDGGEFEYFVGTKSEADALAAEGKVPPSDRCVRPEFPGPGWAIALHGNMVVHRAGALRSACERISMVNGYVATDCSLNAQSRTRDLIGIDDDAFLYSDWARYSAWRSQSRLAELVDRLEHNDNKDEVIAELEFAVEDVRRAVEEMRAGKKTPDHYE